MEWRGFCHKGYGRVRIGKDKKRVHIEAYKIFKGLVPVGHNVLHHCDNPGCWEETHLWSGTQAENLADMQRKRRGFWQRPDGRRVVPMHKMYLILECRYRKTAAELAAEYGITPRHVRRIWREGVDA